MDDAERQRLYEASLLDRFDEPRPVVSRETSSDEHKPMYPPFGGRTYDPAQDGVRLSSQLGRTLHLMSDGEWRTLRMIANATGDPEASISARLRDFRKKPFGGHKMDAERITGGLWRYRLRLCADDEETP